MTFSASRFVGATAVRACILHESLFSLDPANLFPLPFVVLSYISYSPYILYFPFLCISFQRIAVLTFTARSPIVRFSRSRLALWDFSTTSRKEAPFLYNRRSLRSERLFRHEPPLPRDPPPRPQAPPPLEPLLLSSKRNNQQADPSPGTVTLPLRKGDMAHQRRVGSAKLRSYDFRAMTTRATRTLRLRCANGLGQATAQSQTRLGAYDL